MARSLYRDQDLALPTVDTQFPSPLSQTGLWHNLPFWRSWSLLASAVLLMLALHLGADAWLPAPLDSIVIINDGVERPAWLLRVDGTRRQLKIQVLHPQQPTPQHSFELWLLSGQQPPRSLGLLPLHDAIALPLSADSLRLLPKASGFAVSLEPAGGSPTAQPTGPFLYQGVIVSGI